MNILTFDIEEWAQAKAGGYGTPEKYSEYDNYLDKILNTLEERNFKGTFFCTGLMAKDFPQVVKLIHSRGHEVGCHSFNHRWLNKMNEEDVYQDTRRSIDALEQCIGQKVISYRAPAFSIGIDNKWVFEILERCGIRRDASVYPAMRDFGGFANFNSRTPVVTIYNGSTIKEFPVSITNLCGHELAYSGGGYFRFFPFIYIKKVIEKSDYVMTYFHIRDLSPQQDGMMSRSDFENYYKIPGTIKNRLIRYLKSNIGKKTAFSKMVKLIQTESFVNLEQADQMIDWGKASSVVL